MDGILDKKRLPNYDKNDYQIIDGKKQLKSQDQLNQDVKDNTYFRCPDCNQSSLFIEWFDIVGKNGVLYFIDPFTKTIYKYPNLYMFEFNNLNSPRKDFINKLLNYKNKKDYIIDHNCFYDNIINSENSFSCLWCFLKSKSLPASKKYLSKDLINKYQNPIDMNCDYQLICSICGEEVLYTMFPNKNKITNEIQTITKFTCSNPECFCDNTSL